MIRPAWIVVQQIIDQEDAHLCASDGGTGRQSSVHLTAPLPVVIFYATAIVDRDGNAVFLDDIYGEDRKLDAELQRWSARAEDGLARLLR